MGNLYNIMELHILSGTSKKKVQPKTYFDDSNLSPKTNDVISAFREMGASIFTAWPVSLIISTFDFGPKCLFNQIVENIIKDNYYCLYISSFQIPAKYQNLEVNIYSPLQLIGQVHREDSILVTPDYQCFLHPKIKSFILQDYWERLLYIDWN